MNNKNIITIQKILKQEASKKNMSLKKYYEKYLKENMDLTYSSFYLYSNGTIVPPFQVWSELNKKMKIGYREEELLEIFNKSKILTKETRTQSTYNLNLRLRIETINDIYRNKNDKFNIDLAKRASEVFADDELAKRFKVNNKRQISAYIAYLISKDLKESKDD